jgi:hypothetical protein
MYQWEQFAPETAKYLINKIYSVFISINYKHFTYYCLILGTFIYISTDYTERVYKKQKLHEYV